MAHPPRFQVLVPARARLLLPPGDAPQVGVQQVRWHHSRAARGADLEGPWMLRACVRLPLAPGTGVSAAQAARWVGAVHFRWLCQMGLRSASPYVGPVQPAWAAFSARGPGDVLVGTRKVCHVASAACGGDVLVVASTLLKPPAWSLLGAALGRTQQDLLELHERSLAVSMLLGQRVEAQTWAANLRDALQAAVAHDARHAAG